MVFLLYEPFTPNKLDDPREYNSRHNFSFAREGYALPDLSIKPTGNMATIEWKRSILENHQIQFINSGKATTTIENLKESLFDFVNKVTSRLDIKCITGTLLQEEWESIQSLDREDIEFCKIAASTGIGKHTNKDTLVRPALRWD